MYDEKQKEVFQRVKETFPDRFSLCGFPGEVFRISEDSSYFSGGMLSCAEQDLMLYTQRLRDGRWSDFAKGTVAELRGQLVAEPTLPPTPVQIPCTFTSQELIDLHEGLLVRIVNLRVERGRFGTEDGRKVIDEAIAHLTTLATKVMDYRVR